MQATVTLAPVTLAPGVTPGVMRYKFSNPSASDVVIDSAELTITVTLTPGTWTGSAFIPNAITGLPATTPATATITVPVPGVEVQAPVTLSLSL